MPLSAWIMLAFGCLVLYGGLGFCLWVAWRHRGGRAAGESRDDPRHGGPAADRR